MNVLINALFARTRATWYLYGYDLLLAKSRREGRRTLHLRGQQVGIIMILIMANLMSTRREWRRGGN